MLVFVLSQKFIMYAASKLTSNFVSCCDVVRRDEYPYFLWKKYYEGILSQVAYTLFYTQLRAGSGALSRLFVRFSVFKNFSNCCFPTKRAIPCERKMSFSENKHIKFCLWRLDMCSCLKNLLFINSCFEVVVKSNGSFSVHILLPLESV